MNKKEAASELEITTRTLERHMSAKRIAYSTHRGKTGDEAVFDPAEVARFKAELKGEIHAPAMDSGEAPTSFDNPRQELMRLSELPAGRFADMMARAYAAGLQEVVQRLPAMLPPASNGHAEASLADLAHKLTLSLMEAAQLSGLSRGHLRQAIENKKLKARIIGRGWRVKRDDLEAYVKKL